MKNIFARLLRGSSNKSKPAEPQKETEVFSEEPAQDKPSLISRAISDTDEMDIGQLDEQVSGWMRSDSNELFEGYAIDSNDVVVDVGCGDGVIANFCAQWAQKVIIDTDRLNIESASKRKFLKNSPHEGLTSDGFVPQGCRL